GLRHFPQYFLVYTIALVASDPENYVVLLVDHFAASATLPDRQEHLASCHPLTIDIDSSGVISELIGVNGIGVAILDYLEYLFDRVKFANHNLPGAFEGGAPGITIIY